MANKYDKHITGDRWKWAVSFTLIIVLVVGMVFLVLEAFTPYKPSNGFKADIGQTEIIDGNEEDDENVDAGDEQDGEDSDAGDGEDDKKPNESGESGESGGENAQE